MPAQRLAWDTPPASTPNQLWQYVEAAWTALPQGYIESLFDSVPRRVAVVIANNGSCTNYLFCHHSHITRGSTRGLLATDHVILNHGQVTWTTPELAPPLLTTTPRQRENVSALDRFNVHRCPTRRVFSGTGLEPVTKQATVRYLYHSATAAPFFFEEMWDSGFVTATVTSERYADMLQNRIIPSLADKHLLERTIFMQDGVPPHIARRVKDLLRRSFGDDRVLSRYFHHAWPTRSPDLSPCDY
ncbi:uncharacterized protein TNCV_1268851 [Trichonephila clavipes]|nr:uncharacterized protein TNCV_1268851 [Trichonephila clavipes]